MSDQQTPKNVIDMKERRKQRKAKKLAKPSAKKTNSGKPTFGHYIQFFLFLVLLAYFMKTCSGG